MVSVAASMVFAGNFRMLLSEQLFDRTLPAAMTPFASRDRLVLFGFYDFRRVDQHGECKLIDHRGEHAQSFRERLKRTEHRTLNYVGEVPFGRPDNRLRD